MSTIATQCAAREVRNWSGRSIEAADPSPLPVEHQVEWQGG